MAGDPIVRLRGVLTRRGARGGSSWGLRRRRWWYTALRQKRTCVCPDN